MDNIYYGFLFTNIIVVYNFFILKYVKLKPL